MYLYVVASLCIYSNKVYHCVLTLSYTAQRTYKFAADTETDLKEWKAAIDNCMAKFISGGTINADSHTRLVRANTPS